jgi:hypothetical protein
MAILVNSFIGCMGTLLIVKEILMAKSNSHFNVCLMFIHPDNLYFAVSTALHLLSCCCSSVLNSTWSSWHRWFLSQLKSLWRHVTGTNRS